MPYSLLLRESFHPDVLRNALERDRLFDRLWIEAQYCPYLKKVISAERHDLWRGDVPIFTTRFRRSYPKGSLHHLGSTCADDSSPSCGTQSFITSIGGFSGWGGIIYTLTHLGTLWNQPDLIAEAEGFVDSVAALIEKDDQLDIIGGAAGSLPVYSACIVVDHHIIHLLLLFSVATTSLPVPNK